jgi:hypothetical protein
LLQFRLRAKPNLLSRFKLICPVQSHLQKYSASPLTQISAWGGIAERIRQRAPVRAISFAIAPCALDQSLKIFLAK